VSRPVRLVEWLCLANGLVDQREHPVSWQAHMWHVCRRPRGHFGRCSCFCGSWFEPQTEEPQDTLKSLQDGA
jgi:hypothetical protein